MISRIVATFSAVAALAACVPAGTEVTEQQMSQFSPGHATYQDVRAAFGEPTTTFVLLNGDVTVIYSYSVAYARPETYVPIIGPFIGDMNSRESAAVFRFNASKVLTSKAMSTSYIGTDVGLTAAGTK
jgi:hypothetical protein